MRSSFLLLLCVLLGVLARPGLARAHQNSVAYLDAELVDRRVDVTVRLDALDLAEPLGLPAGMGAPRALAVERAPRASRYVAAHLALASNGQPCASEPGPAAAVDTPGGSWELALTLRYRCPQAPARLSFDYGLLFEVDPQHQCMARLRAFGGTSAQTFRRGHQTALLEGAPPASSQLVDHLALGVEHILTGYDHIAFLLGLLLACAGLAPRPAVRAALGVVTAFTLAHSLTLALAALGVLRLPSRPVESAIALSVLYVALENTRAAQPQRRAWLAFLFGLVHGLGFAGALAEVGLPRFGRAVALLGFNLGVELGQLGLACALLPALLALAHAPRRYALGGLAACVLALGLALPRWGVPRAPLFAALSLGALLSAVGSARAGFAAGVRRPLSVLLALLSALWLVERVAGRVLLRGALG